METIYHLVIHFFYGVLFSGPLSKSPLAAVTAGGLLGSFSAVHIYTRNFLPVQRELSPISWRAFVNSTWAITHEYVSIVTLA